MPALFGGPIELNITSSNRTLTRKNLVQAFFIQCLAAVFVAGILCFFSGLLVISFLAGVCILLLGNLIFFLRLFFSSNPSHRYSPTHLISRFYTGALFKWLILFLGCYVAFKLGLVLWAFVLGFILVLGVFYTVILFSSVLSGRLVQ